MGTEEQLRRNLDRSFEPPPGYPHPTILANVMSSISQGAKRSNSVGVLATIATGLLAITAVTVLLVARPATKQQSATAALPRGTIVALLANNHLVSIASGTEKARWNVAIADPPDASKSGGYLPPGHRLALSADHTQLYALPPRDYAGGSVLIIADAGTGSIKRKVQLPADSRYSTLSVAASGTVYLVGQRNSHIVISMLDPSRAAVVSTFVGRDMSHFTSSGPVSGTFSINQALVTLDGTRLYLGYSGGLLPKSGVDWLDLTNHAWCEPPNSNSACAPGLSGFNIVDRRLLIATWDDPLKGGRIEEYSMDGKLIRHLDLRIAGGFLLDFTTDPITNAVYVIGSCAYLGGLNRLDINSGQIMVIAPPDAMGSAHPKLCGQRAELAAHNQMAIAMVERLLVSDHRAGIIQIVDVETGGVIRAIPVEVEALDLKVA